MIDPVIAKDGHSYDREAIQQWFDAGHNTSPKENNIISTELTPNHGLKTQIQDVDGGEHWSQRVGKIYIYINNHMVD